MNFNHKIKTEMKQVKKLSTLLLCASLTLSSCMKNESGDSLSIFSTGSVYKTQAGMPYIVIDQNGVQVTGTELKNREWNDGDRVVSTSLINFNNQTHQNYGIYDATITGLRQFDCLSTISAGLESIGTTYKSDTLPTLLTMIPFINYRRDDDIITFAYKKYGTSESGNPGTLKLVQPRRFEPTQNSDTLYLVYDQGTANKNTRVEDFISFKLPPYPVNTSIKVVIRFHAENYNMSSTYSDQTSKFLGFVYRREEKLE